MILSTSDLFSWRSTHSSAHLFSLYAREEGGIFHFRLCSFRFRRYFFQQIQKTKKKQQQKNRSSDGCPTGVRLSCSCRTEFSACTSKQFSVVRKYMKIQMGRVWTLVSTFFFS